MVFRNRSDAGRRLAALLADYRARAVVVLGLPRGGVVVAYEVAELLDAPLDVLPARKLGAPMNPEFAIGAMAPGVIQVEEELCERLGISRDHVAREIGLRQFELERMGALYRTVQPGVEVADKTAILVDDGLATGATAAAAVESLRRRRPARIVFAAPVGSQPSVAALGARADVVVCPWTPEDFVAVGDYYEDFGPTSDEEVLGCLRRAQAEHPADARL